MANFLERDVGIDVARAGLVAMMLVFHSFGQAQLVTSWDINANLNVNRWMGQVSGSFPFLIGFLLGFRYLLGDQSVHAPIGGLITRGIKLIGLFLLVNLILIMVEQILHSYSISFRHSASFGNLSYIGSIQSVLSAKTELVAYELLMPLGEIVLIGAAMLKVESVYRNDILMRCSLVGLSIIMACLGNLSILYLSCGIMGLALGSWFARPEVFKTFREKWHISLIGLVPGIILTITEENGPDNRLLYLISVAGLFFAFHNLGRFGLLRTNSLLSRIVNRFARRSLIIYLVHIPALLFLGKLSGPLFGESDLWFAFTSLLLVIAVGMGFFVYFLELYQPRINQFVDTIKLACCRLILDVRIRK